MSNAEKRRQFDSVDEGVDDNDVPSPTAKIADEAQFVELYGPVFEREGRFSKVQPVVQVGAANASKKEIEQFYSFWYGFDSWRSFEYNDKEANEGADSRDEKRYQEKKNKSERDRKKKEDRARVRSIIEQAEKVDPRLKRIKAEEKAARDAKKKGYKPGVDIAAEKKKAEAEAEAKADAEAKKAAEEKAQAEADKADRDSAKKTREAAKKNLKREKKAARTLLTSLNYLLPDGQAPGASLVENQLYELDAVFDAIEPTDAPVLRKAMEDKKDDRVAVKSLIVEYATKAGKTDLKGFA